MKEKRTRRELVDEVNGFTLTYEPGLKLSPELEKKMDDSIAELTERVKNGYNPFGDTTERDELGLTPNQREDLDNFIKEEKEKEK